MVGELCSQFDGLEGAIYLDRPEERMACLSTLMSQSDWTTAIRAVLVAKAADLPTSYPQAAEELSQDGASLAFHDVGTLGSLLGCRVTIHSTRLSGQPFSVGANSQGDPPHVLLYHHDDHFDLLCPILAAPRPVPTSGTDGGRRL